MLRLIRSSGNLCKNSSRILAGNLQATASASCNFASMPEPQTNPDILYTGVSAINAKQCK